MVRNKWMFCFYLIPVLLFAGCSSNGDEVYSGTIEGEEIPILSQTGGAIETLSADEGDQVKKGQLLAVMDERPLKARLKEAEAAAAASKAALDEAKAGTRDQEIAMTVAALEQTTASIQQVYVEVQKAQAGLEQRNAQLEQISSELVAAQSTLNLQQDRLQKVSKLFEQGAISENELKTQQDVVSQAKARHDSLSAQLAALKAQYTMAQKDKEALQSRLKQMEAKKKMDQAQLSLTEEGASELSIARLFHLWEQAEARVEQMRLELDKARVAAMADGVVLRRNVSLGEVLQPNFRLFTLLNMDKGTVKVYVPEAHLNRVKLGGTAEIMVDAYPDKIFAGTISHIAEQAEFTPRNVQTPDERTKLVFAVTVDIEGGLRELKPGMPADVRFPQEGE